MTDRQVCNGLRIGGATVVDQREILVHLRAREAEAKRLVAVRLRILDDHDRARGWRWRWRWILGVGKRTRHRLASSNGEFDLISDNPRGAPVTSNRRKRPASRGAFFNCHSPWAHVVDRYAVACTAAVVDQLETSSDVTTTNKLERLVAVRLRILLDDHRAGLRSRCAGRCRVWDGRAADAKQICTESVVVGLECGAVHIVRERKPCDLGARVSCEDIDEGERFISILPQECRCWMAVMAVTGRPAAGLERSRIQDRLHVVSLAAAIGHINGQTIAEVASAPPEAKVAGRLRQDELVPRTCCNVVCGQARLLCAAELILILDLDDRARG